MRRKLPNPIVTKEALQSADEDLLGSHALTLCHHNCTHCFGLGRRPGRGGKSSICHCVWRAVFRRCYNRFAERTGRTRMDASIPTDTQMFNVDRWASSKDDSKHQRSPGRMTGRFGKYAMKDQEFVADFVLLCERALLGMTRLQFNETTQAEPLPYKIFKLHFLEGHENGHCCAKLGIDRGSFFHEVYRIESALGQTLAAVKPFALYPIGRYYSDPIEKKEIPLRKPEPLSFFKQPAPKVMCAGA